MKQVVTHNINPLHKYDSLMERQHRQGEQGETSIIRRFKLYFLATLDKHFPDKPVWDAMRIAGTVSFTRYYFLTNLTKLNADV